MQTDTLHRTDSLPTDLLEALRARAAEHDRTGRFPVADLDALRAAGWLLAAAPEAWGGRGLDLARLAAEQRRLARYAPATALSTCMHHYWVGLAADLHRLGHPFGERILAWVEAGEVLASGHAEVGNDVPLALSTTRAERVTGGWRLHGRKMFGSLGPVWDRMGIHAMDASDASGPRVIHGFVAREAPGVTVLDNWDAHGMRATESHDTAFDGAFLPDADVLAVVPAGPSADPAVGAMAVWALTLVSNVYVGIAERLVELSVEHARARRSIAVPGGAMATNPFVQHQVADMHLELAAARTQVDRLADDWLAGVDHGPGWQVEVFAAKWRATSAALRVADLACEVVGGSSFRRGTEVERLTRDVRAARFHPATDALAHEVIGRAVLGIDAAAPRW